VVECLPSKHEALNSNPHTAKKEKKYIFVSPAASSEMSETAQCWSLKQFSS
jgi:hypothetical protein